MRRNQRTGLLRLLDFADHDNQLHTSQFHAERLLKSLESDLSPQSETAFEASEDSSAPSVLGGPIHAIVTLFMAYCIYQWYHNRMWTSASPSDNDDAQKSSEQNVARSNTVIRRKPQDAKANDARFPPPDDSDGDDDDMKKQEPRLSRNISSTSLARFACPYFKRTPHLYFHSQSCRGPGWRTVNHMKGHLFRRHRRQPQCSRCYQTFPDENQLIAHQRCREKCDMKTGIATDGFDQEQEKKLKKRKSTRLSEADRWREMYQILFPQDLAIPSPYYDEDYNVNQQPSPEKPDSLAEFASFCERELPRKVQQRLDLLPRDQHLFTNEEMMAEVVTIVRDCQKELLPAFREGEDGPKIEDLSPTKSSFIAPASTSRSAETACWVPIHHQPQDMMRSTSMSSTEEEPVLGYSDKSSSSESLETLTVGLGFELPGAYNPWGGDGSFQSFQDDLDIDMGDFLTFTNEVTGKDGDVDGLGNGDGSNGLFIV